MPWTALSHRHHRRISEWLGAVYDDTSTGGFWSDEEKSYHINYLELLAEFMGLQTFFKTHYNTHLRILTDNTTTIACIASVSVGLGSKESPRNGTGTVFCPREIGARAKIRKRGWGRGRKETFLHFPPPLISFFALNPTENACNAV